MPDFLYIPGDLRQQYLPFTIAGPGKKQVFSFKDRTKEGLPAFKQVSTFSRWLPQLIENDSSFQYSHGPEDDSSKVTLKQFLDEIPSLQIREFVPDAKLTQTFKWFSYFKKGFDVALQNVDGKSFSFSQMKDAADKVMNNLAKTIKGLTSGMAELLRNVVGGLASLYEDRGFNVGGDDGYAVLFLPFILYYRLTTTHTNNVYELPYAINSEIMKSDGTYGWTNSRSDFGFLDTALDKASENSLIKMALGNTVRINTMPSFQPTGETHGETITINVDLINDTDAAAAANFLMCHTLFGNNRWLQYGFVQAGASLYDVKLPGANRYMMCAGQFSCKAKGAFRSPSDKVLNAILSGCKTESNKMKTFGDVVSNNNSLKQALIRQKTVEYVVEDYNNQQKSPLSLNSQPSEDQPSGIKMSARDENDSFNEDQAVGAEVIRRMQDEAMRNAAESGIGNSQQPVSPSVVKQQEVVIAEQEQPKIPNQEAISEYKNANVELTTAQARYNAIESDPNHSAEELANAKNYLDAAKIRFAAAEKGVKPFLIKVENQAENDIENMISRQVSTASQIKDLIKIPDVYSLTLTFTSLLPDNFNNYLYGFRGENLDPIENYVKGNLNETGVFEQLVQQLEAVIGGGGG